MAELLYRYRCPCCHRLVVDSGLCVKCWDAEASAKRDPLVWRPRVHRYPTPAVRFWELSSSFATQVMMRQ